MRVEKINNQNFKARHPKIREMEKTLRIINADYPTFSVSKFGRTYSFEKNSLAKHKLALLALNMVFRVRGKLSDSLEADSPVKYFKYLLQNLTQYKLANCDELVTLFNFIAGLNGTKAYKASLCPSDIDHVVSVVPLNEKAQKINFKTTPLNKMRDIIIVDPWLGFADFAPNMAEKYGSVFKKLIGSYKDKPNFDDFIEGICLDGYYLNPTKREQIPEVTDEIKQAFLQTHPHLFFSKRKC